jgi:hypothetical protein
MANRHKKAGGGAMKGRVDYSGGKENVAKEARSDANFKRGGKAEMKAAGSKGKHRIAKARGGGCDQNPFSSAHRG